MGEDNLSTSETLLLTMHNLCVVKPEIAKTGDELANAIQVAIDHIVNILHELEENGYVRSVEDAGVKKFYLTSTGILKVCSVFT